MFETRIPNPVVARDCPRAVEKARSSGDLPEQQLVGHVRVSTGDSELTAGARTGRTKMHWEPISTRDTIVGECRCRRALGPLSVPGVRNPVRARRNFSRVSSCPSCPADRDRNENSHEIASWARPGPPSPSLHAITSNFKRTRLAGSLCAAFPDIARAADAGNTAPSDLDSRLEVFELLQSSALAFGVS